MWYSARRERQWRRSENRLSVRLRRRSCWSQRDCDQHREPTEDLSVSSLPMRLPRQLADTDARVSDNVKTVRRQTEGRRISAREESSGRYQPAGRERHGASRGFVKKLSPFDSSTHKISAFQPTNRSSIHLKNESASSTTSTRNSIAMWRR